MGEVPRPGPGQASRGFRMVEQATRLLERAAHLEVFVVGDAALDQWSYGHAHRLGRDGPVPVVDIGVDEEMPGAAANLASNAAALGARVRFAGIVGRDATGDALLASLEERNVDVSLVVRTEGWPTASKHRVVCDGIVTARFDRKGERTTVDDAAQQELAASITDALPRSALVLVGDYGLGALGTETRAALARGRQGGFAPLVVDGHDFAAWAACHPTAVTPNAEEVAALLGRPLPASGRSDAVAEQSQQLLERSGADMVLATLDVDGSVLLRSDAAPYRTAGVVASPQHTCGAGDTVSAAFGLALAAGMGPEAAADLAAAAGACVVGRAGTSRCTGEELLREVARTSRAGVLTHAELATLVAAHRAAGGQLVFTNGCFDVLHLGHVQYLQEARALGDLLVVAVNSDASVRRLKGEGRPIVPERERAGLLAALDPVDAVTIFADDSPHALIEALRPELYVKGGDYTANMLAETELVERLGGRVVTVGYLPDHSTTELVHRIQADRAGSVEGA